MIKLLIADFDGTLREYEQPTVSRKTLDLLTSLSESGVEIAVASGRTYGELKPHFGELANRIWFICCDGAYLVKEDKLLYDRRIVREDLRLFDRLSREDHAFVLHGAFQNYCVGQLPGDAERYKAVSVSGTDAIREPIYKVTLYGEPPRMPAYCGLRSHWDGGEHAMSQYVNRFSNKGTALSDLQTRLMLTKFDTVCMGDSGNDIAMMHNAKRSFCIGTRCKELAAICTDRVLHAEDALLAII